MKLLGVFSGPEYYFKVSNGDELYSVTAVYVTYEVQGKFDIDKTESIDVKYFNLNQLPEGLTEEYRGYIEPYIKDIFKK
jgi:hypothetical protein